MENKNEIEMYITVCPYCHRIHRTPRFLNSICPCGAKYYYRNSQWYNRNTKEWGPGTRREADA